MAQKLIPVLPKNYRRIALHAIESAGQPVVLVDRKQVDDFSEAGALTQKGFVAAEISRSETGRALSLDSMITLTRCGW